MPKNTSETNSTGPHLIRSKCLKVTNIIDPKKHLELTKSEYEEIQEDMRQEFQKYGNIEYLKITVPNNVKIGMESGSVFIMYS